MSEVKWVRIKVVDDITREGIFKATGELYKASFDVSHQEDWENFAQYVNFGKQNVKELCGKNEKEYIVENYIFSGLVDNEVAGMIYITAFHTAKKAVVWYAIINPERAGASMATLRKLSLFTLRSHLADYDIIFELERIPFSDMKPVRDKMGEDIALVKAKYGMVKQLSKSGVRKLSGVRYREPSLTDSPKDPPGKVGALHLSVYLGEKRNKPPETLEHSKVIKLLDLIYNKAYYCQSLATDLEHIIDWRDHYAELFEMSRKDLPKEVPLTPLYTNNIPSKLMICYADKDNELALVIKDFIEAEGIEVDDWHATSEKVGDPLLSALQRMIISSQYFVFLATPNILKAEGVHAELAQVSFWRTIHELKLLNPDHERRMPKVYFLRDYPGPSELQNELSEFLNRYFPLTIDGRYSSIDDLVNEMKKLCNRVRQEAQIGAAVLGFYTCPTIKGDPLLVIPVVHIEKACTKLGIDETIFEKFLKSHPEVLEDFWVIIENSIKRNHGLKNVFIATGKLADICISCKNLGIQLSNGNIPDQNEKLENLAEVINKFKLDYGHEEKDVVSELTPVFSDIISRLLQIRSAMLEMTAAHDLEGNKESAKIIFDISRDLPAYLKNHLIRIPY